MKRILYNTLTITLVSFLFIGQLSAEKYHGEKSGAKKSSSNARVAAGCIPAKAATELNLNNVRARINTGGDMWWDLQGIAQYEIPKGTTKTSMFSASLWLGGTDVNGQLKGAFQRYRGNGNDYWPGPLTDDGKAAVDQTTCTEFDKHFVVYREQVDEFLEKFGKTSQYPEYVVPKIIQDWPGNGDITKNQNQFLAPFMDVDGNGIYEWQQGDYPYYDVNNSLCKPKKDANGDYYYVKTAEGNGILADQVLKGDQTLWWVFNDNGNIHTESSGNSIGVEIRAQAFAFATNDEINNMTFYTYEIINRSSFRLTETYFSQWVDTDLGYAQDDFVGCDVKRGLGYCYNGKAKDGDGKPDQYGFQPPAIGVDFFQGPYMDADGKDNPKYKIDTINGVPVSTQICDESINGVNFGDSIIDNERFGMRRFLYHNNTDVNRDKTDPRYAAQYYLYLRGFWKNGIPMTYGGDAYNTGGPACDFMFPDETDPCDWGTGGITPSPKKWTEETASNFPGDRRFMQSAGPFTLESGAVNYITVGIPWARASSGGPFASVELLRKIDDKAQALFNNCFKVLDGPDAPELIIQELDRTIILYLKNIEASNNAKEDYTEEDVTIPPLNDTAISKTRYDSLYHFQGYQIFQLRDASVSIADIRDADKARIVVQCDLKDDVENLINFVYDDKLGASVPNLMVEGENKGIRHSFRITEDQFAAGDPRLVNQKKYYFVAIAYSFNEFLKYSQNPDVLNGLHGQKTPYLAGRKSAVGPIKVHTAIPHIPDPEADGTIPHSNYGDGPKITRIDGRGNGGNELQLTKESIETILKDNQMPNPEYTNGHGPIKVKVIDPLRVEAADYVLRFDSKNSPNINTTYWILEKNGEILDTSDVDITIANEQLFLDEGISIEIGQISAAGDLELAQNGMISSRINYKDSSRMWFSGVRDVDGVAYMNWIRSGTLEDKAHAENNDYDPAPSGSASKWLDPQEYFEKVVHGTWAPYRMASKYEDGPAGTSTHSSYKLSILESVDIYLTSDKSKWTRCVVIETGDDYTASQGNKAKFQIRAQQSIDKDGKFATSGSGSSSNEEDANYISETGMGWFPGYAISLETGERLNIMYGESSWLVQENGADMQFNPTSKLTTPLGDVLLGGKHFLYVFRHSDKADGCPAYDAGEWISTTLGANANNIKLMKVHREIMWCSIPLANQSSEWLNNDAVISLRVTQPYQKGIYSSGVKNNEKENDTYPMYSFNTGDLAVEIGNNEQAETALDLIRVVPNPYYAFSSYEDNQLDNRVKITNLPERCTISIYSTNGTLVRRFKKDETNTFLDWDLKNHANIPIASGIYYIHVDAPGIGEKVIKWFGVLRPVDLNAF